MMNISTISLLNPDREKVREDKGAKTSSFFVVKRPVKVDRVLLDELRVVSDERGGVNVRVCLHDGPDARHHDMVILERKGKYYRPHKHEDKGEAFHVIEGCLGVVSFNEQGDVIDAAAIYPHELYRVEAGMYHAVAPVTEMVIYHENKPGPFLGDGDSIYPDWAPDGTQSEAVREYVSYLYSKIESARHE